jgi:chaperone required for assembly of F1-ATPase
MSDKPTSGGSGPVKGLSREAFVAPRPRRFFKAAGLDCTGGEFRVALDGRVAKTPGKRPLALPTHGLAEALVAEWEAQGSEILAETMPLTRLANTVIDGVAGNEAAVRADILAFSGSDLLCYRASMPEGLVQAQSRDWDRVLAWARDVLGAEFVTAQGIIHIAQPETAIDSISRTIETLDAWQLAPLHQMTTLTGSALLAIARLKGALTLDQSWRAAHVDEDWQISQWGEDAEAAVRRQQRWRDMLAASRFLDLIAKRPS